MPETRGQKRAAVESLNPLYYADVLDSVLTYVGPEQWLFIGLVSRKWANAYRKVPPIVRECAHILCEEHKPTCVTSPAVYRRLPQHRGCALLTRKASLG
jgi:hypothetical protein